jgi:hypothetical protein
MSALFTGTLDNWDPAVTDPLGDGREVILLDSAGVGQSTGKVPCVAHRFSEFRDVICRSCPGFWIPCHRAVGRPVFPGFCWLYGGAGV